MWFVIIWFLSSLWAFCFIPWSIDRGYSPIILAIMLFPIINTIFAICRTYHYLKHDPKKILQSIKNVLKNSKDLFAE